MNRTSRLLSRVHSDWVSGAEYIPVPGTTNRSIIVLVGGKLPAVKRVLDIDIDIFGVFST